MRINTLLALVALVLLCLPHMADAKDTLPEDKTAARVLVYFMVGRDETPEASVTTEQFKSHLELLKDGGYNVASLPDISKAYKQNTALPDKTVSITFDGGDKSILTNAVPLLERHNFPYTLFISTDRTDANDPRYLNWDDIDKLSKSGLMTVGLHPQAYSMIGHQTAAHIRSKINNATSRLRDKTGSNAKFFSYPFGKHTNDYKSVLSNYNFDITFGQHSGVAHSNIHDAPLPRFTMTENYADLDRFTMIINSLPLSTTDITPTTSYVTNNPAIGFSVSEHLTYKLSKLSCFTSGQDKPTLNIIGNRVEIRLDQPSSQDHFRVNCTMPVKNKNEDKTTSWRWLGFLFHINEPFVKLQ